jgi:DNA-binding HxlR family transcriptional regulator
MQRASHAPAAAPSAGTMASVPPSPQTQPPSRPTSPLASAAERVGDRWTLQIVDALLGGPRRFNDLQDAVAGIAPNVLSQRLKHLEREAILVARPYSERPPRLAYELTASGRELAGVLKLMAHWGARSGDVAQPLRHAECGTPLEAHWYCPTCARPVEEDAGAETRLF